MNDLAGLDAFSRSFADALFAAAPELRAHATVTNGVLQVECRPGPEREHGVFWVTTECDEITVGFGMWHTHFDWPARPDVHDGDPIACIRGIMADELLVEDWTRAGKWSGSTLLGADEEPDLDGFEPEHVCALRSWSGARDRTFRWPLG